MSDYLQRLVNRAIPVPNIAPAKLPEVRPSLHPYLNAPGDQLADFEIEPEMPVQPLEMPHIDSTSLPASENQPTPPAIQARPSRFQSQPGASENPASHPNSEPTQIFFGNLAPGRSGVQKAEHEAKPPPLQIDPPASSENGLNPPNTEQPEQLIRAQSPDRNEPEISALSENVPPYPNAKPDSDRLVPVRTPEQAAQPPAQLLANQSLPEREIGATPELEPQVPSLPEMGNPPSEPQHLVIGSLTVEVLPAAAPTQAIAPAVQVTQVMQAAQSRHSRPSKLRFGLGQM